MPHEPAPLSLPRALYTVLRNPSPVRRADEAFLSSLRIRRVSVFSGEDQGSPRHLARVSSLSPGLKVICYGSGWHQLCC